MLSQLNQACRRLGRDESGVVLAMTVVIFLTLFVIACSVYAVGENIRLRIETQNAADAAAYSAAVVQADTLSRIASINRAMGWTYAQQVKMEMDFIVDRWLVQTMIEWLKDYIRVRIRAMLSMCSSGPHTGSDDYYAGDGFTHREHVKLNRGEWVSIKKILQAHKQAAAAGKSCGRLGFKIIKSKANIRGMNRAEVALINKMEDRMHRAAQACLRRNIDDTENDRRSKDRNGDIRFAFLTEPKKCFTILSSEHFFLRSVFGRGTSAKQLFGEGTDTWFVQNGNEIGRHYRQMGSRLVAEWKYRGRNWCLYPPAGECLPCPLPPVQGNGEVKGQDVYMAAFFETSVCEPQILTPEYFEKAGAVVVGVARLQHNPFQFMFPRRMPDGLYGLYSVPMQTRSDSRYIWSVAAARAGYRDHGRTEGSYNPTVDSFEQEYDPVVPPSEAPAWWKRNHGWQGLSPYNLTETDWDAVFIPLHRAWSQRTPSWQNRGPASGVGAPVSAGRWQRATAAKVLAELWDSAGWESLRGRRDGNGLSRFADGKGPIGMEGDINYHGVEDQVFH